MKKNIFISLLVLSVAACEKAEGPLPSAALSADELTTSYVCVEDLEVRLQLEPNNDIANWARFDDFFSSAKANTDKEAILNNFSEGDGSRISIRKQLDKVDKYKLYQNVEVTGLGREVFHWGSYQFRWADFNFNGNAIRKPVAAYCVGQDCRMSTFFESFSDESTLLSELLSSVQPQDCGLPDEKVQTVDILPKTRAVEEPFISLGIKSSSIQEMNIEDRDNALSRFVDSCAGRRPTDLKSVQMLTANQSCRVQHGGNLIKVWERELSGFKGVHLSIDALMQTLGSNLQKVFTLSVGENRFIVGRAILPSKTEYIFRLDLDGEDVKIQNEASSLGDLLLSHPDVLKNFFEI